MADKQPFEPHKPEVTMTAVITLREARMLQILRSSPFGKFTIQKINNVIVRVERGDSILIEEDNSLLESFDKKQ